ncbi:hypothetical protein KSP39_PZI001252 [Platanthera zijinensis]|uniref:RNase H type-1 domain-containing protein n=1 Tax=Platanthera zijinensis TaxID=2320716 RepID=A0AAP0C1T0_9ASPA
MSRASGLAINLHKSRVVFSRATPEAVAEDITAILVVDRCARHELYLGVPTAVGRSRHQCFTYIMDRVWERIRDGGGRGGLRWKSWRSLCESKAAGGHGWRPPAHGSIKINFDGAVRSGPPMVGAGVIARDSSGGCLDWRSEVWCHMDNPLVSEALAARLAIEMAVTNGWTSVVVEGDCATVIHHLATLTVPFSLDRPIIRDALALARSIPTIEFVFARRSCNRVAHAIASASFLGPRSLPDSVLDLIQMDLANE